MKGVGGLCDVVVTAGMICGKFVGTWYVRCSHFSCEIPCMPYRIGASNTRIF